MFLKTLMPRYTLPLVVILMGIMLSIAAVISIQNLVQKEIREEFEQKARECVEALRRESEVNLHVVLSVQALCNQLQEIKRSQFRDFATYFLSTHQSIRALEWIPRIPNSARETYEEAARESGFPGFRITDRMITGKTVRSPQRKEYFPVYFVEPYRGNEIALGFDLGSDQTRLEALERSRDTGEMVATSPITLVQETTRELGFLVFAPIYQEGKPTDSLEMRRKNLRGFALGVFRVGEIVEKTLTYLNAKDIDICLYDNSTPEKERLLYHHPSSPTTLSMIDKEIASSLFRYTKTFNLAGREWLVLCTPSHDYIAARKAWWPWGVLVAGLSYTFLIGIYLLSYINRAERIEKLVTERTFELARTNEALLKEIAARKQAEDELRKSHDELEIRVRERTEEVLLKNKQLLKEISERGQAEEELRKNRERLQLQISRMPIGCIVLSPDCQLMSWNPAAERIFGFTADEILGKCLFDLIVQKEAKPASEIIWHRFVKGDDTFRQSVNENIRKDGEVILCEWSNTVLKEVDGRTIGVLSMVQDITERKRAEEALRKSEEKAHQLALENGIMAELGRIIGSTLNIVEVYEQFAEKANKLIHFDGIVVNLVNMKDYTRLIRYAAGTGFFRYRIGEALPLAGSMSEEVIRTKSSLVINGKEELIRRFPGSELAQSAAVQSGMFIPLISQNEVIGTLSIQSAKTNIYTERDVIFGEKLANQIAGAIANAQLFIEQKRTEEALQKSESCYKALFNFSSDPIFIHDLQGRILDCNQVACEDLGYSREEFLKMDLSQIDSPKFAALIPERMEALRAKGRMLIETVHVARDGREIPTESSAVLFEYNGIPAVLGVARNITERKRAEEALRESEDKLRLLLDSTAEAIYGVDVQGRCTFCNPACLRLLGYKRTDELLGKNMHDLIHYKRPDGTFYPVEECRIFQAFKRGEGIHVDDEVFWKADGTSLPVEHWSYPQRRNGEMCGSVVTFIDITERKRAEEQMKAAKEAADAANCAKSEFLANMSHEIRTPMNGVMGMSSLLIDTDLTAEQREYAETIMKSADSLLAIINDILDFSKIESGKLELETFDFDLRTMLEDMNDVLTLRAGEKGLELLCLVEPDVPALLQGDPGRLRQILINLIGNAIKFTHRGEVVLHVSLDDEDEREARIRFVVKDTGIGIPGDKIGLLFQAFTQGDTSITRKYGGTGLGLSISRQLVELMGGQIGVESEEGKGSSFWFAIPLAKQASREKEEARGHTDIAGTRVLVVDDNPINLTVVGDMLKLWNCQYEGAADASSAMEKLRGAAAQGAAFQIAILDMCMPGTDGETLGRMVKDDPVLRDTILVMMTSLGNRGDAVRLEEAGFAVYLTKPVKQSQLYDCLVAVLHPRLDPASDLKRLVTRYTVAENRKRRIRILLAEDNVVNQKVALKILEKLGYEADAVANGLEAIEALKARPYTVVLMDVQMPEMDGIEATRQIRGMNSTVLNRTIPIIALTAHAMKGDHEKLLEAGMSDYVPKPIRPNELAEVLSRWISISLELLPGRKIKKQPAVFEKDTLIERLGDDREAYQEVISLFLRDVPEQIQSLEKAFQDENASMIQRQVHTLKGASGNVGAVRLERVAVQMEEAAGKGDMKQMGEIIQVIKAEFEELRQLFQSEKGDGP